ncbi:MAG: hypothetical protein BroJett026_16170 [Betaproteobacteria bacterium]|nr:MAG: hypothetical protein BroJett026_16170 [Betaproteobacteria bacterium]
MALLIGFALALSVGAFARLVGWDRDRSFYPTVTVVIACLYCFFAVMGGSTSALRVEIALAAAFVAAAVAGFRASLWIVVAALAAHGILDAVHGEIVANPGVPPWWPAFCATYDLVAAGFLAWLLASGRVPARA